MNRDALVSPAMSSPRRYFEKQETLKRLMDLNLKTLNACQETLTSAPLLLLGNGK
jgi:hypothetical protein